MRSQRMISFIGYLSSNSLMVTPVQPCLGTHNQRNPKDPDRRIANFAIVDGTFIADSV